MCTSKYSGPKAKASWDSGVGFSIDKAALAKAEAWMRIKKLEVDSGPDLAIQLPQIIHRLQKGNCTWNTELEPVTEKWQLNFGSSNILALEKWIFT